MIASPEPVNRTPRFKPDDTVVYCGRCKSAQRFSEPDIGDFAIEWPTCCGEPVILISGRDYRVGFTDALELV